MCDLLLAVIAYFDEQKYSSENGWGKAAFDGYDTTFWIEGCKIASITAVRVSFSMDGEFVAVRTHDLGDSVGVQRLEVDVAFHSEGNGEDYITVIKTLEEWDNFIHDAVNNVVEYYPTLVNGRRTTESGSVVKSDEPLSVVSRTTIRVKPSDDQVVGIASDPVVDAVSAADNKTDELTFTNILPATGYYEMFALDNNGVIWGYRRVAIDGRNWTRVPTPSDELKVAEFLATGKS